ncbi:G-type lectin S-receptor-like serine/threonine-protein kinase At1g67520 isoform X3 [Medicago truncatula]|nr:G-type lectin S-receptor-like serine/threonine-protein kinase At1g67520 isoform X3 [Medicago truncatula]
MNFEQLNDFDNLAYLSISPGGNDWHVWIANRDQPVDMDSAVLSLNQSGALKIESKFGKPITLYASHQPLNRSTNVATLLDSGNFVLKDTQKNTVLWQSFDHPTDSLLPGMKLGLNHKTGENWSLVSWIANSKLLPASGPFRLDWEPIGKELVIKHREKVYWKSGKLIRHNKFEHIAEDKEVQYTSVSNESEDSISFTLSTDEDFTIWALLGNGQLINRNRKGDTLARADVCYGYNTYKGCQKYEDKPACRNFGDVFTSKIGYPNKAMLNVIGNASYSISDCQAMCWRNCRCFGFKNYHTNGTGCMFFLSSEGHNIAAGGQEFYLLQENMQAGKHNRLWIWISVAIATALLIISISILYRARMKRKYMLGESDRNTMGTEIQHLEDSKASSSGNDLEVDLSKGDDLKVFSYSSIKVATNDFSSENKLGQGGFGSVFKGILPSGQEVAVKRLSKSSGQGIVEFKNELNLICKLQHTNLVQLIGHCIHEQERILIYEYLPNKSLDFFLFDSTRKKLLDWNKRFSIIEGIAQGLLYLHKYSRLRIIHRDLKPSNILLDESMNPKISDFGVARMFMKQESEANTDRIVGTYGYMSPEYAMEGIFSTKSDVYSFGVLLLEIISGRKNNSFYCEDNPLNLVGHVWELWKEGEVLRLVDSALNDFFSQEEVLRCVHVGLLCVQEHADDRPNMSNVISMLTNKSRVTVFPKKPAYYGRTTFEEETCFEEFTGDFTYSNSCSHSQLIQIDV